MNKLILGENEYFLFVDQVASLINDDDLVQKARQVEYGQWELPFEALLLAMLKQPIELNQFDFELTKQLAIQADLIDGGVLDVDTWEKFEGKFKLGKI